MRSLMICAVLLQLTAGIARAQTFDHLQVRLGGYTARTNGGERPVGVWFGTGPIVVGKTSTSTFSVGPTCKAFAVSSDGSFADKPTAAWRIEVTPTAVAGNAVTFRLRWQMARLAVYSNRSSLEFVDGSAAIEEDTQLILRPGEWWAIPIPRNISGYSCDGTASIRVSVDIYPWEEDERRLIAAELWLVERLADGSEVQRSQPLSVRGLPSRPVRFYFDRVVDGDFAVDIYGLLSARPASGALAVTLETRCRWPPPPAMANVMGPQRSVKSEVEMKPGETVEIRLPALGEDAGPFAKRALSIRIRVRQLR